MNLCDDGHDEVCYEVGNCPACELKSQIESLEGDIDDLKEQIANLKNLVDDIPF